MSRCQVTKPVNGMIGHALLRQACQPLSEKERPDGFATDPVEQDIARRLAQTPSLLPLAWQLALAAGHDVTVLITGETGSGKTWLAGLIHDCSPRRREPFVTVSCGAVAPNLVESEFFGHVPGAFTGAARTRPGKFAAAGRGTLLLDEIDALALEQQSRLLRVLESGEYDPVGSDQTRRIGCRVLVASNADLRTLADQGKFRRDLYYRLNVLSFALPPLRERLPDIVPLARALAARFSERLGKELSDISPEALAALESYPWPGNIRELENVLTQAVLVSKGPILLFQHLPPAVREQAATTRLSAHAPSYTLKRHREVIERNLIQRALENNGRNRALTARALGINRITLYNKIKKYGLTLLER